MSATQHVSKRVLTLWTHLHRRPSPIAAPKGTLWPVYQYSTEAPPPPLLSKLKADLKNAMRAKDAPRLAVLRSVISTTLNASKTATPITTDAMLVALLRKNARACQEAIEEFRAAGRHDLVEKEEAQISVLEEYSAQSGIQTLSEAELRAVAQGVISELAVDKKNHVGEAMKQILSPGGPLDGKAVEKSEVARIVKEEVGRKE